LGIEKVVLLAFVKRKNNFFWKNIMHHEFALYVEPALFPLCDLRIGNKIVVHNTEIIHRMCHVLRLQPGQSCMMFNREMHAEVTVVAYHSKKSGEFLVQALKENTRLKPSLVALLPILKREAFETACYNLVELGASIIQPIVTHKVQRSWGGVKEQERIHKIMIAAAEQSKNYAFPVFQAPIPFEQALTIDAPVRLYCDPDGEPLINIAMMLRERTISCVACMIGPEGDLTMEEKNALRTQGFLFCALTPTILRSSQAMSLAVGAVRSLFR
jgi:16S rRNA (uracil1498-N3)-methyltransferase